MKSRRPAVWNVAMATGIVLAAGVWAEPSRAESLDLTPKPLDRVTPGLVIGEGVPEGWTHVVSLAKPRLGAGDIEQLPKFAAEVAEKFSFVILARVGRDANNKFFLERVALGNAMEIDGKMTVVSKKTHEALGADLNFISSKVLASSEDMLEDVKQVARYGSMIVFDAPAIIAIDRTHRTLTLRNVIWASTSTGDVGSVIWLMNGSAKQGYELVPEKPQIVLMPPNLREDRVLRVDKSRIRFGGIPAPDAIAMAKLPPGRRYDFTPTFEKLATTSKFTPEVLRDFATELSKTLSAAPATAARSDPATGQK